jgi:hypothetical protein
LFADARAPVQIVSGIGDDDGSDSLQHALEANGYSVWSASSRSMRPWPSPAIDDAVLISKGRRLIVRSGQSRGAVDQITAHPDRLAVSGWAFDDVSGEVFGAFVAYHADTELRVADFAAEERPDVISAGFARPGEKPGFHLAIELPAGRPEGWRPQFSRLSIYGIAAGGEAVPISAKHAIHVG